MRARFKAKHRALLSTKEREACPGCDSLSAAAMATSTAVNSAVRDFDALLGDLASLLSDLIDGSNEEAEPPSSPTLESSGRFWQLWHQLKQRHSESLSVALLALAKSGEFCTRMHPNAAPGCMDKCARVEGCALMFFVGWSGGRAHIARFCRPRCSDLGGVSSPPPRCKCTQASRRSSTLCLALS